MLVGVMTRILILAIILCRISTALTRIAMPAGTVAPEEFEISDGEERQTRTNPLKPNLTHNLNPGCNAQVGGSWDLGQNGAPI